MSSVPWTELDLELRLRKVILDSITDVVGNCGTIKMFYISKGYGITKFAQIKVFKYGKHVKLTARSIRVGYDFKIIRHSWADPEHLDAVPQLMEVFDYILCPIDKDEFYAELRKYYGNPGY